MGLIFLLIVIAAEPYLVLFILSFGYVASGPITTMIDRRKRMSVKNPQKLEKKKQAVRLNRQDKL